MCPFFEAPEGFSAEMLDMLDRAFTAAWHDLQMQKSPSASAANQEMIRTVITKSIVDLAATGVRDPERLKRHALHAAEKARPHTRAIIHLPE